MKLRNLVIAAAVAAVPLAASATTFDTVGSQTFIRYDNTGSNVHLGNFDLAVEPVGVVALFAAPSTAGSLSFGVTSSGGLPARGSIDVVIMNGVTYSGMVDGTPLNFTNVDDDFVASFGTMFAEGSDVANFSFEFAGFEKGDQFQLNVAAIPLPTSVLMLIGALGGLVFLGRRRSV